MGFLESIFFRNWPRPLEGGRRPDLTLDLKAGALGEIKLYGSSEKLKENLGPPASWSQWHSHGRWHYPELGIWFEASKQGIIEGINLEVREGNIYDHCPGWKARWQAWNGSIWFPAGPKLSALTVKQGDFLKLVGEPDNRDDDPEGPEFMYCEPPRFTDVGFDVEFTSTGDLLELTVYALRD